MEYGDSFEVTDKNAFFKEQQEIASDLFGKLKRQEYFCIRYNNMPLLYNFDIDTPEELLTILAQNLQQRRLEKGLSRDALSTLSGVPVPTIAKFEQKHTISLASYVALAKALGYSKAIKNLLAEPLYNTMEELDTINRNKNRKRGRNEIDK